MIECVINLSEGRRADVVEAVASAARPCLLDVHTDAHHHRSVLTLAGDAASVLEAARRVAAETVRTVDLRSHAGVHPRLGAVDVVPFVPLVDATMSDALEARDEFAAWAGTALEVPCFLYGPERTLPEVRRSAFTTLVPDTGPPAAHPTAGAICVGARPLLVAFNVWLAGGADVDAARRIAAAVRRPEVRALGLDVGGQAQVSMNLVEPLRFGPAEAYDAVAALAGVDRGELVGLVPSAVLDTVPTHRWAELDLSASRTIEARAGGGGFRPTSG